MARNSLTERGILTVRHAAFKLPGLKLISDLYHPPSKTVYEVKTRTGSVEPNFRPRIPPYRRLAVEGLVRQSVFIHVRSRGSAPLSFNQWREIREAGIGVLMIRG